MKVVLIHQIFGSPDQPGGTRHYELASHCVKQGIEFSAVTSTLIYLTGKHAAPRRRLVTHDVLDGIHVYRTYTYPSLHKSFFWRVVAFLSFMFSSVAGALAAGKADIVMGTSPPIFQAVSAWVVAVIRRATFLLEIRDLWPEFAIDIGVLKNPVLIYLSRKLENFLYARADHLLVNSPAYRDYLINKGIAPEKVTVISNGVDPDKFDPDCCGERIRRHFKLDGEYVVTYAGALGMANDLKTLLEAASLMRDEPGVRFLIVGDGKERSALEEMAASLELANVTFTGAAAKKDMAEVLGASDACVALLKPIPMFRTTYPNKVFDYMAAGRPTVLAIDGVIRQVIEAAHGGIFVPPGNPELLAAAIRRISSDRAASREMGKAARSYVVANFNRHKQAQEFACLLEHLAGSAEHPKTREVRSTACD